MSVEIVSRTIGATPDKRAAISNDVIVRPMIMGNNWTKLRLLALVQMNDKGWAANLTGKPMVAIGVQATGSDILQRQPVGNAVYVGITAETLQYVAGAYYNPQGQSVWHYEGTTLTEAACTAAYDLCYIPVVGSTTYDETRCLMCVEITKGSPNWSIEHLYHPSASPIDVSDAAFENTRDAADMAAAATASGMNAPGETLTIPHSTIDEATNGLLSNMFVAWNRTTTELEVCRLGWRRIS